MMTIYQRSLCRRVAVLSAAQGDRSLKWKNLAILLREEHLHALARYCESRAR